MHAAGHAVEIDEAGAETGQRALALMVIFDGGDRLANQFLHRIGGGLDAFFADLENVAFDFVEQCVHFAFMLVGAADDACAGENHLSQDILLANNGEVIIEIRGGRNGVGQRRNEGDAADGIELLFVFEALLERDGVDRHFAVVHLHHGLVNGAMAKIVENVGAGLEFFNALAKALGRRQKNAAENALLGFQ